MSEPEFYDIVNADTINAAEDFGFPKSVALYDALVNERDFRIINLLKSNIGVIRTEYIVVEVECDGVPSNNPFGIMYRERLALCIYNNSELHNEVLALRKGFPVLSHQNETPLNTPISLCLYFEPPISVYRTWTPIKFLKRIKLWLEKSSKDELHAADQPLEQLFHASKYELILPWSFTNTSSYFVSSITERIGGGQTYVLSLADASNASPVATPLEFTLPPVTHGHIFQRPSSLSELNEVLQGKNIDIVDLLKPAIISSVGTGMPKNKDDNYSIILLHIPICRTEGSEPEKVTQIAFLVLLGRYELGEKLGALFQFEDTYYESTGGLTTEPPDFGSVVIMPMDVIRQNDAASARMQSGLNTSGPVGCLVGVGSLGGSLLDLWIRSGWGEWTIIDNDHIKPHNLTRHVADFSHVGLPKVEAMLQINENVMQGAIKLSGIYEDACNISNTEVQSALKSSQLVIDCSTSLEYPRIASTIDNFSRHFSVFVTPDGSSAVLLAEDSARLVKLRSIEAQYYRAIISSEWGESHLSGNLGTFWSGAGCRDISAVLSFSGILGHACTVSEYIQATIDEDGARAIVWERLPNAAGVRMHEIPIYPEEKISLGDVDIYFDQGLKDKLRQLRKENLPNETGGVLLGYHDFNLNMVVLVDALSAPVDSDSSPTFFERGVEGVLDAVMEASERTAAIVGYIGEWHSHPVGYSANASADDIYQLVYLSLGMADEGLPALSLIISEDDIQPYYGEIRN